MKYTILDKNWVVPTYSRNNFVIDDLGRGMRPEFVKKSETNLIMSIVKVLAEGEEVRTAETVKNWKYDVKDNIFHRYRFLYYEDTAKERVTIVDYRNINLGYRVFTYGLEAKEKPENASFEGYLVKESNLKPIPNPFLNGEDVRAYVLVKSGIWYIRGNVLYYMDARSRLNIEMLRFDADEIMDMGICGDMGNLMCEDKDLAGELTFIKYKGITQTAENRDYYCEDGIGKPAKRRLLFKKPPDGYIDEYELQVEQVTIDAVRLLHLKLEKIQEQIEAAIGKGEGYAR